MRAIDDAVSAPHGLPSQFTQYADDTMVHDIDPDSASPVNQYLLMIT